MPYEKCLSDAFADFFQILAQIIRVVFDGAAKPRSGHPDAVLFIVDVELAIVVFFGTFLAPLVQGFQERKFKKPALIISWSGF
jgi:hypothetical protein